MHANIVFYLLTFNVFIYTVPTIAITNFQWSNRLVGSVVLPRGAINLTIADGTIVYISMANSSEDSTICKNTQYTCPLQLLRSFSSSSSSVTSSSSSSSPSSASVSCSSSSLHLPAAPPHTTLIDFPPPRIIYERTTHLHAVYESFDPGSTDATAENLSFSNSRLTILLAEDQPDLQINSVGIVRDAVLINDVVLDGAFTVKGNDVRLDVHGFSASTVLVDVQDGVVRLFDVQVDPGTQILPSVDVSSGQGDIYLAPSRAQFSYANLLWSSPCAYVCLPSGHYVDESECPAADASVQSYSNETFSNIRKCRGRPCDAYYTGIDLGPTSSTVSVAGQFGKAIKFDPQSSIVSTDATADNTLEMKLSSKGGTIYLQNTDYRPQNGADYNSYATLSLPPLSHTLCCTRIYSPDLYYCFSSFWVGSGDKCITHTIILGALLKQLQKGMTPLLVHANLILI